MACARFNFSHGTAKVSYSLNPCLQSNARLFKKFIEAKRLRPHKTCALMLEIRGREIRTNEIDETSQGYVPPSAENKNQGGIMLRPGHSLFIATDNMFLKSTNTRIQCSCKELPRIVKPSDVIYLDDGKLVFLVTDCE
jgi:pyruvate kinase